MQYAASLCCFALCPFASLGHDIPVHQAITYRAQQSARDGSQAYGAFVNVFATGNDFDAATNAMVQGSTLEDNKDEPGDLGGKRSLNHFYDPLSRLGLSNIPPDDRTRTPIGQNSFVWASTLNCNGVDFYGLAGLGRNVYTHNAWSWQNARGYERLGLTESSPTERRNALNNMFRAIGQVIHLLEDTTQPQHVRNEQHLDQFWTNFNTPWHSHIEDYGRTNVGTLNYQAGVLDWKGAGFTKLEDFWNRGKYTGQDSSALKADASPTGNPADRLGLAEFSNGNFLGERHLFPEYSNPGKVDYYPFPSRKSSTDYDQVKSNPSFAIDDFVENGHTGKGIYLSKVADGVSIPHFSRVNYLGKKIPGLTGKPYCTTADPNVNHDYLTNLIPKAVAYSAGLLDYFFRGRLEVTASASTTAGNVSLQIKNISGTGEKFQRGNFRLFYERATGGDRMEISSFTTTYSPSSGLDDQATTTAEFTLPGGTVVSYLLVFQGTIGSADPSKEDPVDKDIAIATTSFTFEPQLQCQLAASIPAPDPLHRGTAAQTTEAFIMPTAGGAVRVHVNLQSSPAVGDRVMVDQAGEFDVTGYTDTPGDVTITIQARNMVSQALAGTQIPAGRDIAARGNPAPWKAVYAPSVKKVFVTAGYDMILVVDPISLSLETYFHVNNLISDYVYGLVYAPDVDRLYWLSSLGKVYVINPATYHTETTIDWTTADHVDAEDGFCDPINHHVGFGYGIEHGPEGLLVISTSANAVAADIADASFGPAEYCALDNRIYSVSSDQIIHVYSADTLAPVSTLQPATPDRVSAMHYCPATGEIYCDNGAFYIDPIGSASDSTTADVPVPAIGSTATFSVGTTSGMAVNKPVRIGGIIWTIVSIGSTTQFAARNLTTQNGTVPSGTSVRWGNPVCILLPQTVDSANYVFYDEAHKKMVFPGYSDTVVLDPISKAIICTTVSE
jgi:hypothetical protein